jgi:hypothetical protein
MNDRKAGVDSTDLTDEVNGGSKDNYQLGKFSKQETNIIVDFIHHFIKTNDLTVEDVIPQMRDEDYIPHEGSKPRLWKELAELLPNRKPGVRSFHMN